MFTLHQSARPLLLALAVIVRAARADYYIDDTNTTLTYLSSPDDMWAQFTAGQTIQLPLSNGTHRTVDSLDCYNHTLKTLFTNNPGGQVAPCGSAEACILEMPFTGSGITIFVYQVGSHGINASISIDGGRYESNALSAPPAPNYEIFNVSMFDVQKLDTGSHTLWMTINDLAGSSSNMIMIFDYAYVNETLVSAATATTTSTSFVPSSLLKFHNNSDFHYTVSVWAIIGSILGGIALIVIGTTAALCLRRRRRYAAVNIIPEGEVQPCNRNTLYDPAVSEVQNAGPNSSAYYITPSSSTPTPLTHNSRQPLVETSTDLTPFFLTSPSAPLALHAANFSSERNRKTQVFLPGPSLRQSSPDDSPVVESSARQLLPSLTDEQADFITDLYNHNIPTAAVARVLQRMLVDRHAGVRECESEIGSHSDTTTAPPSYRP
ncbi:hypothetical protein EDC04DRAFT_3022412 [Pisolithus marmoratus]|nr:hypothetical protein EDC04DRAFT_3022412 [Pisolithus marmoratus]